MNGKVMYGLLVFLLLAFSTWQWQRFDLPSLKHSLLPSELPSISDRDTKTQLSAMLAHSLWDKRRGAANKQANAALVEQQGKSLAWSLKGIGYQQMHAPVAVIAVGSNVKMYHEGDRLPDGALLMRIMASNIVIEENGEERHVYLFKEK